MNRHERRKAEKMKRVEDRAEQKAKQNEKAKESLKDLVLLAKSFEDIVDNINKKGEDDDTKTG